MSWPYRWGRLVYGMGVVLGCVGLGLAIVASVPAAPFITVASTTSTQNSGLYDYILPKFTAATSIEVRIVALGTGAALRLARNGDADVLLVHHRKSELEFVASGYGVERYPLMYNDFVLVGPAADPAGLNGLDHAPAALARIAEHEAVFASRGDDSGTHKRELELWKQSGYRPGVASGTWYRETGSGMGATLNTAAAMSAYTLTDRATWVSFRNKRDLVLHVERGEELRNEYGVIMVSPERHPHVKASEARAFIRWLQSEEGRRAIGSFRVSGQQLFYPLP